MSRRAIAYIRKSVVQQGRTTLSWEIQEAQVRELAARYGDTDLEILSDWGRSGRGEKTHLRSGYRRLLEEVEADRVTVIYAYSLSRLSRSLIEYSRLAGACQDHGVRIRLAKEGELEVGTPSGRLVVGMLALVAQMEAELAQERTRDMIRARRQRGDRLGREPYGTRPGESLQAVISAYEENGTLSGTARLLNDRRVPTRQGGHWYPQSVKSVLETKAPELLPLRPSAGVPHRSTSLLARLLRCHCGVLLTPAKGRYGMRYRCYNARVDSRHGRDGVSESLVLPWVKEELARVRPPVSSVQLSSGRDERRTELHELLRRNRVAFLAGDLEDGEYLGTKKALDAELEKLDAEGRSVRLDAPDWEGDDPGLLNEWARSFIEYVELDEDMRPVRAKWLLPDWRVA